MTEWSRSKLLLTFILCLLELLPTISGSIIIVTEDFNVTKDETNADIPDSTDPIVLPGAVLYFNCSQVAGDVVDFEDAMAPGGRVVNLCLALALVFYMFVILAKVCDGYLVPCIKILCCKLGLTADVAGATLMAAAVSSPDLFINLVGTFVTEGDIGVGTVFGCGMINMFLVPPLCLFFSDSKSIRLDWWAVTRDVFVNGIAVLMLAIALRDNLVVWQEAALLVAVYISYIIFLINDTAIKETMEWAWGNIRGSTDCSEWQPILRKGDVRLCYGIEEELIHLNDPGEAGFTGLFRMTSTGDSMISKIWWIFTRPVEAALYITIPDPNNHRLFPLTFVCCLLWVAGASYLSALIITIVGVVLHVPDSLMGLTLIAMGMSVPGVLSSIIVAKQGHGGMAVANALGSNIFDVLAVLGVPWLVKVAMVSHQPLEVNSKALPIFFLILLFTLSLLYISLATTRFRITTGVAVMCLVMYFFFMILAGLMEMNIFSFFPTCHL